MRRQQKKTVHRWCHTRALQVLPVAGTDVNIPEMGSCSGREDMNMDMDMDRHAKVTLLFNYQISFRSTGTLDKNTGDMPRFGEKHLVLLAEAKKSG